MVDKHEKSNLICGKTAVRDAMQKRQRGVYRCATHVKAALTLFCRILADIKTKQVFLSAFT